MVTQESSSNLLDVTSESPSIPPLVGVFMPKAPGFSIYAYAIRVTFPDTARNPGQFSPVVDASGPIPTIMSRRRESIIDYLESPDTNLMDADQFAALVREGMLFFASP